MSWWRIPYDRMPSDSEPPRYGPPIFGEADLMTPRRQRMCLIGLVVAGVAISATLALRALQENMLFFFSPTQVAEGEAPYNRVFRLGGMVLEDSIERESGSLTVSFVVTDFAHSMPVRYTGVLPDLSLRPRVWSSEDAWMAAADLSPRRYSRNMMKIICRPRSQTP